MSHIKPDLTYRDTGLFTRLTPETQDGEAAWRQLPDAGVIPFHHVASVLEQLRAAGYIVHIAKPAAKRGIDDDALLAALWAAA